MADYLASIYGTEKDKVNCSFFFKMGACRHGDKCSRLHTRATFSQSILMHNLYQSPEHLPTNRMSPDELQKHFDAFYEDVYTELAVRYGEIEEMIVCDNIGDHLIGNVYVRFRSEEDAERASLELNERFYAGRPIQAELSHVTDFEEACCRQFADGDCRRGGFCNFIHAKRPSRSCLSSLRASQKAMIRERRGDKSSRATSEQPAADRSIATA